MDRLRAQLEESMNTESYVGFCPWEDGDGELWGRVLAISESTFTVQEVDPYGTEDEVEEYDLESILYLDVNPVYASRLKALNGFTPTFPEDTEPFAESTAIRAALEEASILGEVVRISYPNTDSLDVTVGAIDDDWTKATYYDDFMRPKSTVFIRTRDISKVIWRNRRCEADGYLLRFHAESQDQ